MQDELASLSDFSHLNLLGLTLLQCSAIVGILSFCRALQRRIGGTRLQFHCRLDATADSPLCGAVCRVLHCELMSLGQGCIVWMKLVSCGQGDRRRIVNDKGHIGACNLSLYARLGS